MSGAHRPGGRGPAYRRSQRSKFCGVPHTAARLSSGHLAASCADLALVHPPVVRPEMARYTREINEVLEIAGQIGQTRAPLDHYPFSKGIGHWLRKHDGYSTMEAQLIVRGGGPPHPSLRTALTARDFHRAPAAPESDVSIACRAGHCSKWLYMVFIRGAFLDGRPGTDLCPATGNLRVHDRAEDAANCASAPLLEGHVRG